MSQTKDLYEILGINRDATEDEIKKAFRQQARKYHPDNKETGDEERFKELNQAYEILSDPEKRNVYDQYGLSGLRNTFGDSEIFNFGFGDLSDIFSQFFGEARAYKPHHGPERGADLRYNLEIDFLEAINGCTKEITIQTHDECHLCKGSGAKPGTKLKPCRSCNGTGEVRKITESFFGHITQIASCPSCRGSGKIIEQQCNDCQGSGRQLVKREIDVKVPCGVDDGARLRWGGKGEAGNKGGPPGDLYVVIEAKEHEIFNREGQNILVDHSISFSQAALGGTVMVPTTEGERSLPIPPGVQSGTILKMSGLGVPKLNSPTKRGDELIRITVETPTRLSAEEKKVFEQLAKLQEDKTNKKKFGLF